MFLGNTLNTSRAPALVEGGGGHGLNNGFFFYQIRSNTSNLITLFIISIVTLSGE